jgi:phospholipase C
MHRPALVALIVLPVACALTPAHLRAAEDKKATTIKHIVVIFDGNNSFDHYFGTDPYAQPNQDGSVYFAEPSDDTPLGNRLTPTLLTNNPNVLNGGSTPFRLDRSQAATCDNSNSYTLEQGQLRRDQHDNVLRILSSPGGSVSVDGLLRRQHGDGLFGS